MFYYLVNFCAFFCALAYVLRLRAWNKRSRSLPLPPGPRRLPLIGNALDMRDPELWETGQQWGKKYGPLVYTELLGMSFMFVNSYSTASDLFEKRGNIYSSRPSNTMLELEGWDWFAAAMPYSDELRRIRTVLNRFLQPAVIGDYAKLQMQSAHRMLYRLLGSPNKFPELLRQTIGETILTLSYGFQALEENDPYIEIAEKGIAAAAQATELFLVNVFPSLKHLPSWIPGTRFKGIAKKGRQACMAMYNEPFEMAKRTMRDGIATPSFFSKLHEAFAAGDPLISDETMIKKVTGVIYGAAADTTVSTLSSFFLAMLLHPEAQKRAQDELDQVVGKDILPSFEDRPNLPYLEAIIKETLRWQPVTPLAVAHLADEDNEYNGYFIPRGTAVFPNVWAMLRDPEEYPEPDKFLPERWLPEKGKKLPLDVDKIFFGAGRRICPGRYLTHNTMYIFAASILAAFNITKALDENGIPITPKAEYTPTMVRHLKPFKYVLTPRSEDIKAVIQQVVEASAGLINQSVLAGCIITVCLTAHELMKRKRRGKKRVEGLGSVESWQFSYLYQGRSWAKNPSPPYPQGWPLSWVKEVLAFPESKLSELRGVDATLYCRFIRGCFWFTVLHTCTTTVILLPIHLRFSDSETYSPKSMTRALISALVSTSSGRRLLWIHLVLMFWVSATWVITLIWISKGAFRYRAQAIEAAAERARQEQTDEFAPHPHPQHPFHAMPPLEKDDANKGLRLRTVMVTNIPSRLRSEKELKEYFEYYMSRPLAKPSIGLTSSTQPGLINKLVSFVINRARRKRIWSESHVDGSNSIMEGKAQQGSKPEIERVVVARKMTELASFLDRREDMLRRLESAHIRLARKALTDVQEAMDLRDYGPSRKERAVNRLARFSGLSSKGSVGRVSVEADLERASPALEDEITPEDRTKLLVRTLGPYVEEFGMRDKRSLSQSALSYFARTLPGVVHPVEEFKRLTEKRPESPAPEHRTIWEALFSLPRSTLNSYQPLVHLNALFRGRAVPAIDYYTTKVNFLTALITEQRSRPPTDFEPVAIAFVTFANPDDARRACKYLAVHPNNPLACLVSMAPDYEDLDWIRVMKQPYKAELMKDWIIELGVWAFTIIWIIPVSLLVGLVSINNIATVIPGLSDFLGKHEFIQELVQSLIPTVLTSLLMMLIPLLLLLIAKKAHTISTLSALHDRILTRYHKFLVANILVFFCVGVTALESFFTSWKSSLDVLTVIGESFPVAGPFYVGWFIFTIAIHGGFELILLGLPLFTYPITKKQITPRKRAVGIRPRTFNYYYWLPNHILTVILALVFAVLNPLLMPFIVVYYAVQTVVIKNQLLHVYAKNYEGNGNLILIRLGRYTLDGLILAQVIFMAFVGINKMEVHVGLTAVMIALTALVKIIFTRICRTKFEAADIIEAHVVCGTMPSPPEPNESESSDVPADAKSSDNIVATANPSLMRFKTWKLSKGFKFTYRGVQHARGTVGKHKPIPFDEVQLGKRSKSWDNPVNDLHDEPAPSRPTESVLELCEPIPRQASPERTSPERSVINFGRPPLVVPHERHLAWDDSARLDRPYDNPYYTRPIANHLWLPRDPIGLLDLDDTVDVFRALTSDPGLGQLGEWVESGIALAELPSSLSIDDISYFGPEQGPLRRVTSHELSGEEEIALPPEIAERVENIHKETDVEYAEDTGRRDPRLRRPSMLTRNTDSSNDTRRRSISQNRAKTLDVGFISQKQRKSSFMSAHSNGPQPSISQGRPPRRRSTSAYTGQASHSILGAYAPYSRSHISFAASHPRPRTESGISTPVTTREVVVNEVIAEEVHATESRMRDEARLQKESNEPSTRSWLTSWMFSRMPWAS